MDTGGTSKAGTAMGARRIRALLPAAFPGLERAIGPLERPEPFKQGWANHTWLVNGSHVFRFPRTAAVAASTAKELRLMPALASHLGVAVPDFSFAAPHGAGDFPWPFGGYRLVPGVLLPDVGAAEIAGRSGIAGRSESAGRAGSAGHAGGAPSPRLAAGVGRFLSELHSFPPETALSLGVPGGPAEAWRDEQVKLLERVRREVLPLLAPDESLAVIRRFASFLDEPANFHFAPALLHRDLGPEHILVDPATGELTGVIDFEDSFVGDPAFDFTGFGERKLTRPEQGNLEPGWPGESGAPDFETILAHYTARPDDGFAGRAAFYRWLVPFHHIIYGLEFDKPGYVARGLRRLRKTLG